jgi:hypothetical protein
MARNQRQSSGVARSVRFKQLVQERPVGRRRATDSFEAVVLQITNVVGEVHGVALGRQGHVAARADVRERHAGHLASVGE